MRLFFFVFFLCAGQKLLLAQVVSENNDPRKHPRSVNQFTVQQINGKSIDFYLNHKAIGETAKLFYTGQYAIYDDQGTFCIIDSVLTENVETRPFYFFVYNAMLKISDGAVSEYMSTYSVDYIRKFPCEFLKYSDDIAYEVDLDKWILFLSASLDDEKSFTDFVKAVERETKDSCNSMSPGWSSIKGKIKVGLSK